MARVLVTTVPFGERDRTPLEMLEASGVDWLVNPIDRKLTESELVQLVSDTEVLIAGTEPITDAVMAQAPHLRLISRVGVGLDNVDLAAARRRGIAVSYTPTAPAPAVAELTIGLMFSLLRGIHVADANIRAGAWHRTMGWRISDVAFGIVGVGRIGRRVITLLRGLGASRILAHDIIEDPLLAEELGFTWVPLDQLIGQSDLVSLHVPLTARTRGMFQGPQLAAMRPGSWLVNTARGGIVDESALGEALRAHHLAGAAIDVFEREPYDGELMEIPTCLLTAHMGSMSVDCRAAMEIEATREAVRHLTGQPLNSPVPDSEYPD